MWSGRSRELLSCSLYIPHPRSPCLVCTLLYTEWMVNRDLLYSTRDSAPCSLITYMGKEFKKNGYMYVYNGVTLLYSRNDHNIVNQLESNKTSKKKKTPYSQRLSFPLNHSASSVPCPPSLPQLVTVLLLFRSEWLHLLSLSKGL